ncbi:MAG: type II toxin-antitoxin system PemK/MazF family toxin [Burkholderiales bacterium]
MARVPARGDIYHVDLEPTKGKEQRGRRFVFVLSPAEHNRRGLVIVLPVSQGHTLARSAGYGATLMGAGLNTQGIIICDQPRTIDFAVRGARYVESAPDYVVEDVMSRIAPLVA